MLLRSFLMRSGRKTPWLFGLVIVMLCALAFSAWQWQIYRKNQEQIGMQEIDRWRMQAMAGQVAQAIPQLKHAANENNVTAQRALAEVLLHKLETAQEGARYAEQAAVAGDVAAQYMLGKAYFDGSATATGAPDMAKARHWLELAAENQHAPAMYLLGLMYKSGYAGRVDYILSVKWLARAVQLHHAEAMFMLANAYHDGQGVTRDQKQALRLYQAAAEKENPQAAQVLAMAYRDGTLGLKQDKNESEQMLREVAHILSHPDHQ
ncbi:tetratricopeptide repeat protein [Undibacterium sp. Di24W]|uniref:tetratricopeptide repeat protein n=1 Tax=Undibacterium sp. Di24W TaxID=3413033 RepID=UPI003BF20224